MNNESRRPMNGVKSRARRVVSPPLYIFTWWAKSVHFSVPYVYGMIQDNYCRCQQVTRCCCCCVRMDDSSCVMKLVEIVPVDNNGICSESADVKLSPCHIKVCSLYTVATYII